MRYTRSIDPNTTPTSSSALIDGQSGNVSVTPTATGTFLKAFAFKAGMADSPMHTEIYKYENPNAPEPATAAPPAEASYDLKGNLTIGLDDSIYTYDAQNRVKSAKKDATTVTFKYDGLNRQVSRTVNGGAPIYSVWDGWELLEEIQNGSVTAAYLSGPGGLIKELIDNVYYYQDANGSTSHLANSSGQLLEWYRYDLQGTPFFYTSANAPLAASGFGVRHLFTGQPWMSALGLYDLRNRFYSPDTGRFLQPDPIGFAGDPTNLYRYCGNDPVNWIDPSGLEGPLPKKTEEIGTQVSIGDNPLEDGYEFGYDLNTGFGSTERVTVGGPPESGTGWGAGDSIGSGGPGAGDGSGSGSGSGRGSGRGNPYRSSAPFIAEAGQGINGPSMRRFAGAIETSTSIYVSLTIGPWGEGSAAIAVAGSGLRGAVKGLAPEIAATFSGGKYTSTVLQQSMTAYRYSGGVSGATGRFLTTADTVSQISSPAAASIALKLPVGATAQTLNTFSIPTGTRIFTGGADTATQIFVNNPGLLIPH